MYSSIGFNALKYNPWKPAALVATVGVVAGLLVVGIALGLGLGIGLNNDGQDLIPVTTTVITIPTTTGSFNSFMFLLRLTSFLCHSE